MVRMLALVHFHNVKQVRKALFIVHLLSAGTTGTVGIDPQVIRVNLDINDPPQYPA